MRLHFAGGLLPRVPLEDCVSGFQLGVEMMWQRGDEGEDGLVAEEGESPAVL